MSLVKFSCLDYGKEVSSLKNAGIATVAGVLSRDTYTLKTLCDGSLKNFLKLKVNLIHNFASKPSSGLKMYHDVANSCRIVTTGVEKLDEILDGGFYSGETTAVIRVGSTLNVSSFMISKINSKVVFMDSADHFEAAKFSNSAELFHQIKVFDFLEYIEALEDLKQKGCQCAMLVTDCFTDLIANLIGGISNDDLILYIKKALRCLKMIAVQHNVAVLFYCRDTELSHKFMLSSLLHALVDSTLYSDEDTNVKLTLAKSTKHPAGKSFTLPLPN